MSAIQFIIKSIKDMSAAEREAVFAAFAMDAPAAPIAATAAAVAKKPRANAGKPSCHGAWTKHVLDRFPKDSTEQKEFMAARIASAERGEMLYNKEMAKVKAGKKQVGDAMDAKEAAVGAHMAFVAWWGEQHPQEQAEFKAAWELKHPKGASASGDNSDDAATVVDDTGAATGAATGAVGGGGATAAPAAVPAGEATAAKKRGPKKMADMTPEELAAAKAKRAAKKAEKSTSDPASAEGSRAPSPPKVKDE